MKHTTINNKLVLNGSWSAADFFSWLCSRNKLARREGFVFCRVSGLAGFQEALAQSQDASAFLCVSDTGSGAVRLNNSPRTRRMKTVFLAMRHEAENMDARRECFDIMNELFRQLMSVLLQERVRLSEKCIYLGDDIAFTEIDKYFFTGCACAYFQISVDCFTDLSYRADEWGE